MPVISYFILSNLISSISIGVVLVIVPWTLVSFVGSQALIYINIISLGFLLIFRKQIYMLLNTVPARNVMAANMVITSTALSLLLFFPGNKLLFIPMMFISQFYIYFYYVSRGILTKELVTDANYGKYNGILEIENQASAFIAGGLAAYLVGQDQERLNEIIALSMSGLMTSALVLVTKVKSAQTEDLPVNDAAMTHSFQIKLSFIAIGASATFICVKLLDVINPIYVVDVLQRSPEVLAISGIFYTIGAICAGLLGATQVVKAREFDVIILSLAGFLSFCLIFTLYPRIELFYASWCAWGLFNGLSRIAWQTIAMNVLDKAALSKFFAGVTMMIDIIRINLLLIYSLAIKYFSPELSFLYLSAICIIGTSLCLAGQKKTVRS
ncbi:hypothetical protein [Ferruginivarius sediminum]|uniref:MFS transporter n=1 Tax=Ferruginivarius sediminum TaxID=2661937 RepID=A0A369TF42_9PROT|nr:hypothetical protein [Ferruginivarius sediminum]RDD62995.1 hypothetical protein DRB17_04265 [Ferruginivarius sediminum]